MPDAPPVIAMTLPEKRVSQFSLISSLFGFTRREAKSLASP
jgi:hypothetical protein